MALAFPSGIFHAPAARAWSCALLLVALAAPARAVDPGTVKGIFELDGKPIELKYAYAYLHDNAEGILSHPRELRILLTDREVAPDMLRGGIFLPIEDLAKEDKVQGLLFELDPSKPNTIVSTLLSRPQQEGSGLMRTTYSTEGKPLFKRWSFDRQRVTGEIDRRTEKPSELSDLPVTSFAVEFSAPIINEPAITADLKGPAAKKSPHVQVIAESARLLAAGDVTGARKLQSARANRQLDLVIKLQGPEVLKQMKLGAVEMKKALTRIQRVVVRGDRAVALVSKNEWFTLVKEDGRWKVDL